MISARERSLIRLAVCVTDQALGEPLEEALRASLAAGASRYDIREAVLHLTVYASFPKVLQALRAIQELLADGAGGSFGMFSDGPTFGPSPLNFFELASTRRALYDLDPEFAQLAVASAGALCSRPGLTARERAWITLASDIANRAFRGPFQIHCEMAEYCGGTAAETREVILATDRGTLTDRVLRALAIVDMATARASADFAQVSAV